MESRKRTPSIKGSVDIEAKLDKLAEDISHLPDNRKEELKEMLHKKAFSVQDTAGILGISVATLRRLMRSGRIEYFRITNRIRIPAEEIERFQSNLTIGETAEILNVHPETVRRLIKSGRLPAVQIGRPFYIALADLKKLMESEKLEDKIIKLKQEE